MKKLLFTALLGLTVSTSTFASDGIITVLNYTQNPIDIKIYNGDNVFVADVPLLVNGQATGHWFTPGSWWDASSDIFDSVHVFYIDKTTGAQFHCGDIPGGEAIGWGKTVKHTYEIDDCGMTPQGPALKWHPV
jgi:hypothetical protein